MSRWVAAGLVVSALGLVGLPTAVTRVEDRRDHAEARVLDRWTITVQRDSIPDADLMNGLVLAIGAGLAGMAALLVGQGLVGPASLLGFFVASAFVVGLLAVEETFELTETTAEAVGLDPKRTDLVLPLVGLAFFAVYRRTLVRSRTAVLLGVGGGLIFLGTVFVDALPGNRNIEDPLESLASLLLMAALGVLTVDLLRTGTREAPA